MISLRQIISRSAGLIFTIFTLNESFLGVDDRSVPLFTARRLAKRGICRRRVCVCVSVCLSHFGIVSKRLNVGLRKQCRTIAA